tara:strand:+ start:212 stop:400 length:189 start_codon:yes stop_codon:yes gene_type:complete
MKVPTLQSLMRKYLLLPKKKLWIAALKMNRWPVKWWDEQVEARRKKEELRKKRIESLYPKKK